jgi:voltage-gated potassium channel
MNNLLQQFKNLPFTDISDTYVQTRLKNNRWSAVVVDILDGDLWSSKVSLLGSAILIAAILVSTAEYILSNGSASSSELNLSFLIRTITGIIFSAELFYRIRYAQFLGFSSSRWPATAYLFSFLGIVDILTVLPFFMDIAGFEFASGLAAVRILRLWRIARYIKSFSSISDAFESRKEDIFITLIAVLLLSLTLSAFMFHYEKEAGSKGFSSITEVFVWSIGKYTGDYGAISQAQPVSSMGKIIATVNGLLGIALFAIPAGLLASAFIDQLSEKRKMKVINSRTNEITLFFKKSVGGGKHFRYKTKFRNMSFEALQTKLLFSEEEIFECVRESKNLRFRAMKSRPEIKYTDTRIIECFDVNTGYGYKSVGKSSSVFFINPMGEAERGISHFAHSLADSLSVNFISRELAIHSTKDKIGGNKSVYYAQALNNTADIKSEIFLDFVKDMTQSEKDDLVIIISSAASGRKDFVVEYGNDAEDESWKSGVTTISSADKLEKIKKIIFEKSQNVFYRTPSEKDFTKTFTIEENTIGLNKNDSLLQLVRQKTNSDVIAIYINISPLIADDDTYYCTLISLCDIVEELKKIY